MYSATKYKFHSERDFEYLFKALYAQVCLYAQGLVSDFDLVEAIVSDVFFEIWEMRDTLDEDQSVCYIYRMVHRKCLSCIRGTDNVCYEADELSDSDIYEKIEQSEIEMRILGVIQYFPGKCRDVFELCRFEEKKTVQVAHSLGMPVASVERCIVQALRILKEQLRDILPLIAVLFLFTNY